MLTWLGQCYYMAESHHQSHTIASLEYTTQGFRTARAQNTLPSFRIGLFDVTCSYRRSTQLPDVAAKTGKT